MATSQGRSKDAGADGCNAGRMRPERLGTGHVGRVLEEQEKGDTMTEALSEPKATESWMLFFKQPVEG
jgi:hypothetical protein